MFIRHAVALEHSGEIRPPAHLPLRGQCRNVDSVHTTESVTGFPFHPVGETPLGHLTALP